MPRRRPDPIDAIGRIFAGFQFSAPGAPGRVLEQLRPWASRLTISAAAHWLPRLALGMPCAVQLQHNGAAIACEQHAVGLCLVCEAPVCLSHAFVASSGDVICYACAKEHQKAPRTPPPGPGRQQSRPPPRPPPGANERELGAARRVLGVKKTATWPEIQKAYRARVLKTHPDRGGDPEAFRRVQAAYELLRAQHENAGNSAH